MIGDHLTILILTKSIGDKNIFCLVQTSNEITTKQTLRHTNKCHFLLKFVL